MALQGTRSHAVIAVLAFGIGFVASHYLWPRLFGYATAEECAVQTTHEFAARACYGLYPSAQLAREREGQR